MAAAWMWPAGIAAQESATIVGRVVDKGTGRPLAGVELQVLGRPTVARSDLDGKYRIGALPAGAYGLVARLIGFRPVRVDSIVLAGGATQTVNFALEASAVELEEVTATAEAPARASSQAGLLALQQAAASASDGLSLELLQRAPDSDAGQAVTRITGVSVVDQKYVVVRGLNERYNATLLNGVEVASPEPAKRVAPLDVFQASLIESITTTKAATPDRPGDFAGASVDIQTREFPEVATRQFKVSTEWNSETTFRPTLVGERAFRDAFGFGVARRAPTAPFPATGETGPVTERFGESLRAAWTPAPVQARPNVSSSVAIGGSADLGGTSRFGYIASVNYSNGVQARRDRIFRVLDIGFDDDLPLLPYRVDNLYQEGDAQVSWGGLLNFAWRLGTANKITLKNFYTRNAEETYSYAASFTPVAPIIGSIYSSRYVERAALQSVLGGEHRLGSWLDWSWKGSVSNARRDEPENRFLSANSVENGTERIIVNGPGQAAWQFRYLDEWAYTGQTDLGVPISLWNPRDGLIKLGVFYKERRRDFDGTRASIFRLENPTDAQRALEGAVQTLPPDQFWRPEFIGDAFRVVNLGAAANAYAADERVRAAYVMLDADVLPGVRFAGGVRREDWDLDVAIPGRRGGPASPLNGGQPYPESQRDSVQRRDVDYLPSANLTFRLSDRMNVRFAYFESVSRPDPRELSPEQYINIGGECPIRGNAGLVRTNVRNADAKWELFPGGNDLVSIAGFYKRFTRPTITVFNRSVSAGTCELFFAQAPDATVYGTELDLRKALDFLPGALRHLSIGANLTLVDAKATLDSTVLVNLPTAIEVRFAGQSRYIVNGTLAYDTPGGGLSMAVLVNRFDDRVQNYGTFAINAGRKDPDQVEQARTQVDARVRVALWPSVALTVAGRNLTDNRIVIVQEDPPVGVTRTIGLIRPGRAVSVGMSYDF